MRKAIVAVLALSPLMLHAQATPPAQPQAASNVPVLESKLGQPHKLLAAEGTSVGANAGALHISTGVIAPKLVHSVDVEADPTTTLCLMTSSCKFVVGMVVDPTGKPSDIKVLESSDQLMERNILSSVSQYRFKPGTVSNQPVATPVTLDVVVVSPLRR